MSTTPALFGHVEPRELLRVLVVSPHLDDAVLGASHLLSTYPGSIVVTVFAGRPETYPAEPTEWDAAGGFLAGDDVAAMRRLEDRAALELLGASARWLDFVDHQYVPEDERAAPAQVAAVIEREILSLDPTSIFLPMGLANPDHVVTHDAGVLARSALVGAGHEMSWFCYEDSGYKHIPGILAWRVSKLFRGALWPTPAVVPIRLDVQAKRAAVELYKSQLAPLRGEHDLDARLDANVPEQFWRLAAPPKGWEGLIDVP